METNIDVLTEKQLVNLINLQAEITSIIVATPGIRNFDGEIICTEEEIVPKLLKSNGEQWKKQYRINEEELKTRIISCLNHLKRLYKR